MCELLPPAAHTPPLSNTSLSLTHTHTHTHTHTQPRLQCLTAVVDQLSTDQNDFLLAVLPEAVLGMKETNERARSLACDLVVKMGYAAHRCSQLSPQGTYASSALIAVKYMGSPCYTLYQRRMCHFQMLALGSYSVHSVDLMSCKESCVYNLVVMVM